MTTTRKTKLDESIYNNVEQMQAVQQMLDQCVTLHAGEEYAELGVFLGYLQGLAMIHQAHHWQTMGTNYYADHLLFQRLYEETSPEIDVVAEKLVGASGGVQMTNYFSQMHHMKTFMLAISHRQPLATESLLAEVSLVLCGELVMDRLQQKGILTRGIEQALGNVLDKHESHIYLLQQRANGPIAK